ncbi:DEAD/DEAH box helicase [Vibrio zhanjiangensis]|uniref:DEAD/DEAH box helicase n=1 Tax=Vibrio zhanjiangensis TaxID=1046128 RepID=A0ABQ6EU82_9VIBR|nr:helicase-related protein [Vibrio zhanjiangensis]GLT16626.1 DEAD/DEAH box helicase [Vibrio zhanjiangensis]
MFSLPIETLKSDFLNRLSTHNMIVEAETGSGKSTRLPVWAEESGKVLVVEPRRIACTSLAQFIAKQREEPVGKSVGYSIKLKNCFTNDSQIVFVTPGVALRWYSDNRLSGFDTVIVDEFHERRWDTDLLVALLRETNTHRLVVTSATIEGHKLAQYIGAERLQSSGRNHDVTILYRGSDSRQLPESRLLEQRVKKEVEQLLSLDGDILVFLPGRKEIAQCQSCLSHLPNVIVVPLHASVTDQQRDLALTPQSQKKIVLATNVAETSLTIPNIVAVIDSGLERRTEQRNGKTTLCLKHISRASARQRSGRAGRVMDGVCVRLYGQHAALSEVTPPELHREALEEAMLAAACCGYKISDLNFLEPLPEKSLRQAATMLENMGAIDSLGDVTPHGQCLYPLPIDALYADLVARMPKRNLQEAMVDLTSIMSTPNAICRWNCSEQSQQQLQSEEPLGSDVELMIRVLRGQILSGVTIEQEALKEAKLLSAQMRAMFELPQLEVASRYAHEELAESIADLHPELLFVRREKRREAFANGLMEVVLGRNSRLLDATEAILVMDTHSLPGRGLKQTLNIATFTMPVKLSVFEKLNIGEWVDGSTLMVNEVPHIEMCLMYAGRKVVTKIQLAHGETASKLLLEAVKQEDVFPGFAQRRHEQIEHWKLYQAIEGHPLTNELEELSFESWFLQQLEALELTELTDLQMFSADDFAFDGIPSWEYEEFSARYPFQLSIGDLNLTVEYLPKKKLVYVVYQSGLRKGSPKRWELPRWSGWRVQYKKASRIVDVR